jgi:amylosucrase
MTTSAWALTTSDVRLAGYDPALHRHFLLEYFTGRFAGSPARGLPFGENPKPAMRAFPAHWPRWWGWNLPGKNDTQAIDAAIKTIVLLHSMILAFGGKCH